MKRRLVGFVGFAFLAMISAAPVVSQDRTLSSAAGDKWVISAKAGGVNYVQGAVTIARHSGKDGLLVKGDSVDVGDRVATGANGRAEILLNPGSYLRIAENSSFEFTSTGLEDLHVLVAGGSVMLEVFAANDFKVAVSTPKAKYDLVDSGVYRVDVAADGNGRIEVWKGKVEVGNSTLKGGRTASSLDGQVAVAKFDRDERDAFEDWSRDRAKELAKGTDALRDKTLRSSLMRSFLGGRWNMYNSFGLWVYDAQFGRHCFLPFGYGWSSPYGFGFSTDIWWYRLPRAVFYPPTAAARRPVASVPTTGGTTPPPTGTPSTGSPRGSVRPDIGGRKREPIADGELRSPPFVRMQGSGRGTGRDFGGLDTTSRGGNPNGSASGRSTPGFEPAQRPMASPRVEPSSPSAPRGGGAADRVQIRGKGDPL